MQKNNVMMKDKRTRFKIISWFIFTTAKTVTSTTTNCLVGCCAYAELPKIKVC